MVRNRTWQGSAGGAGTPGSSGVRPSGDLVGRRFSSGVTSGSLPFAVSCTLWLTALTACGGPAPLSPDSPLGRARGHLAAERYVEARDAFAAMRRMAPDDPRVGLGLGAAYEGLNELDSAQAVYESLLQEPLLRPVRRQLEGRVRLVTRRRWRETARGAVANEAQLTGQTPTPHTVAVLPVVYLGRDSTLRPLGRALAQFIVTDLAQVGSLKLLEREQIQFLLDEMGLTEQGLVDAATAVRSGRLLSAEQIVLGSLLEAGGADDLRFDGEAVRTQSAEVSGSASVRDRLQRLIDMQKAVVLELLDDMDVVLTPIERERIAEHPTANLAALLSFGEGLSLEDRDEFGLAQGAFQRAFAADPGFGIAGTRADGAASAAAAQGMTLLEMAGMLDESGSDVALLTDNLNSVMGTGMQLGDRMQNPRGGDPPEGRDGVGEIKGEDRLGGIGTLPVTVRRP